MTVESQLVGILMQKFNQPILQKFNQMVKHNKNKRNINFRLLFYTFLSLSQVLIFFFLFPAKISSEENKQRGKYKNIPCFYYHSPLTVRKLFLSAKFTLIKTIKWNHLTTTYPYHNCLPFSKESEFICRFCDKGHLFNKT